MKLPKITDLVKLDAVFARYQDRNLWYRIEWEEDLTEERDDRHYQVVEDRFFEFPISVDDAGGGEFLPLDKGLTFMRWIRKHLMLLESAMAESK